MDEEWSLLPTVSLPSREDYLLEGPFSNLTDWKPGKRIWPLKDTSADFWWPDDHAWLVASDTDLDATYIGCSKACAADLLALGIKGLIEVEADTPTIGH